MLTVIHSAISHDIEVDKEGLHIEIANTINKTVEGLTHEGEFYRNILDKMVINDRDHIDVYLKLLPCRWSYQSYSE
jgi:hypothetical protein